MATDDDRSALDLLDAHLERLWYAAQARARGQEEPLPTVPESLAGSAADGGSELLRWGLAGLARLRREPADGFVRGAGDLVMEFRRRRSPWNAAALRLFEDPHVFVATGPRRHEDWGRDVFALMHRQVPDPRGWLRIDADPGDHGAGLVRPAHPFAPPPAAEVVHRVHRLEPDAAVAALTVMAEEWMTEPRPVRDRPDLDALTADARTLLARYGPEARFWTNAVAAASDPAPDFLATGLGGHAAHPFLSVEYFKGLDLFDELGVIAVGADEVGVFWSIGAF
ncbi:hypothetical protein AB0M92_27310 [Streptomyces sp. NPDC051582]|uniref:hypothetical protein n=1 Tax=Streptomyces sp. NPDC051582 TaxID=3155167 RepID=UPI00341FFEC0